jgi:hypothetical protein
MDAMLAALSDPTIRGWYLLFCFTVLILPMAALAAWYRAAIRSTEGGRALMREQDRIGVRTRGIVPARLSLAAALRMGRDISSGRYGREAKRMQTLVYWAVGLWVAASAVAFGILIVTDEVNRSGG